MAAVQMRFLSVADAASAAVHQQGPLLAAWLLLTLSLTACSTSHEISKVSVLDQEALRPLLNNVADAIKHHRENALNPAHPHQRGTSQGEAARMRSAGA